MDNSTPPRPHLIVDLEVREVGNGLGPVDELSQHLLLRRLVVQVVDEDGPAAVVAAAVATAAVVVGGRRVRFEGALRDALRLDDALDRHRVSVSEGDTCK